jgi:3-oxoacyl-[acyl-carrier protein] reductase
MLNGQVALVTGASRGIGAAIALALGKQGAVVIGTATSTGGADNINASLKHANIQGLGLALDVNSPEQVESVLKTIADNYGDVTILVNNAGITKDTLLMRMKDEDWDAVISYQFEIGLPHESSSAAPDDESAPWSHHQYF